MVNVISNMCPFAEKQKCIHINCENVSNKTNAGATVGVHVCCKHQRPACWGHVTAQV